ncbi:hypothetical protein [Agromyces sp. NPDC055658]
MLSNNPTSDVSVDFTPAPADDADLAWLLRTLFAEPAPEEATPPQCGFDAACERVIRHLDWFAADAHAREVA